MKVKKFIITWLSATILSFGIIVFFLITGWRKTYTVEPYSIQEIVNQFLHYPFVPTIIAVLFGLLLTIVVGYRWWR